MQYAAFQELKTPRLLLRKLTMEDIPLYYERLGSSAAVTEYMCWNPHRDISESVASIQKALRRYEAGKCYRWGIALQDDNALIGVMELLNFDESASTCSFAYMLGVDFWNKGYGTEALTASLGFAFTQLNVDAVITDHMALNMASGAVMKKAGMTFRKIIPGKYEKNGIRHDAVQYGITREQWQKTANNSRKSML